MNSVRLLYISLFILLSVNLAFAGKVQDLDFSKEDLIKTTINERDVVRFVIPFREYDLDKYKEGEIDYELIEKEHKVMIREVRSDSNFIKLTVFIQGAETPQYLNLGFKNIVRLDFDRDNLDDMVISLNKIENKEITFTLEHKKEEDKINKVLLFGRTKRENMEEKDENPILSFLSRLFSGEIFGRYLAEVDEEIQEEVKEDVIEEELVLEEKIVEEPKIEVDEEEIEIEEIKEEVIEEPIEVEEIQEEVIVEETVEEEAEETMKEEAIEEEAIEEEAIEEEAIEEVEIAEEEGEKGLEEITGLTTGRPNIINKLANNYILTIIGLVVLFLLSWNRRYIKRKTRRFFW